MRLHRIILGFIIMMLIVCVKPSVVQAQEAFDFQLVTEERTYSGHEDGAVYYPLIVKGNDGEASYSTSLVGEAPIQYTSAEHEWQINPELTEAQGYVEIKGISSTGQIVIKRYRVTGTYTSGYVIELIVEDEQVQSEVHQSYEHEHYYVPTEVTRPTKWSDGVNAKACIQCGDITEPIAVSSAHVFLQETYQQIAAAGAGETIRLEFGTYSSLPPEMIQRMAEKNDVTFQVHFLYQNVDYDFTIERGVQLDTSQSWYGAEMLIQTFSIA